MTTESAGVRLGDLLTGAGLLKPADLREAMLIAKQQGLPVGRVLIMSAYLTEHQLQAAVQAQSLLKDGLIDLETVVKALTLVGSEEVTLDEAFKRLKWQQEAGVLTNKLGELLFEAGIVSKPQLQSALTQCQTIGLPLGRVLVVTSVLSEQMLAAALNAQVLIRDKKVTREQAIQGLKSARDRQVPIEEILAESGTLQLPINETIRLGELLVGGGHLDEPNLMGAVELGLVNEQPIGQVLRQLGLITEDALDSALTLQKKVAEGQIKKLESVGILAHARLNKISIDEAMAQLQKAVTEKPPAPQMQETLPLYQFLQLAGLVQPKDIETAIRAGTRNSEIMGKMLILSRVMEPFLVEAGYQCNSLIRQGILNTEQAIFALNYCNANGITLEKTFAALQWDLHPDFPGQPNFSTSDEPWPDIEAPTPTESLTPDMVAATAPAAAAIAEPTIAAPAPEAAAPAAPAAMPVVESAAEPTAPAPAPAQPATTPFISAPEQSITPEQAPELFAPTVELPEAAKPDEDEGFDPLQDAKPGSSPLQAALSGIKIGSSPFKAEPSPEETLFKHNTGEAEATIGPIQDPTLFKTSGISEYSASLESKEEAEVFTSPWATPAEAQETPPPAVPESEPVAIPAAAETAPQPAAATAATSPWESAGQGAAVAASPWASEPAAAAQPAAQPTPQPAAAAAAASSPWSSAPGQATNAPDSTTWTGQSSSPEAQSGPTVTWPGALPSPSPPPTPWPNAPGAADRGNQSASSWPAAETPAPSSPWGNSDNTPSVSPWDNSAALAQPNQTAPSPVPAAPAPSPATDSPWPAAPAPSPATDSPWPAAAAPAADSPWSQPPASETASPWSAAETSPTLPAVPQAVTAQAAAAMRKPTGAGVEEDESQIKTYEAIPVFNADAQLAAEQSQDGSADAQGRSYSAADSVEELSPTEDGKSEKPKKRLTDFMPKFGQH